MMLPVRSAPHWVDPFAGSDHMDSATEFTSGVFEDRACRSDARLDVTRQELTRGRLFWSPHHASALSARMDHEAEREECHRRPSLDLAACGRMKVRFPKLSEPVGLAFVLRAG